MSTDELISRVANTAILAGLSLAMIKQIYPDRYAQEKRRRARKVVKRHGAKKKK
jgi:hypothetical protein